MAKDEGFHWTEAAVFAALEVIHPGPEIWTVVPGLPDGTSGNKCRTCDAMAFGCWRSHGIAIHGYEIKVSRADWLHEIQQPEKSQGFLSRCNYWWIAAPDGIVKIEELPATWGLRVISRNDQGCYSGRVKKPATFNPSPSWDVAFIVALARACYKKSPDRKADERAEKAAYEQGYKAGREAAERSGALPHAQQKLAYQLQELRARVAKFEEASGIDLEWKDPTQIGKAVELFYKFRENWGGLANVFSGIEFLEETAEELAGLVGFERETKRKKKR